MGDPQRLLSNISDADELERELLGSIQRIEPAAGAKDEGWARLSAQIAAVALVGTAHGSAAASAASGGAVAPGAAPLGVAPAAGAHGGFAPLAFKLLGSKLAVGLALAGSAAGASAVWIHLHHEAAPAASVVTVAALQPRATEADLPPPDAPPVAELTPQSLPAPDLPVRPSTEQSRKDRLSAESALLTRARAQLRHGDALAAQQSLDQLRSKFPKGVLGQEREVLAIEVLAARGNGDAARKRARAFIAAYPKSPHSAQLSRFADAP
jgi:hypothetical protein